jgi:hypothetical protein
MIAGCNDIFDSGCGSGKGSDQESSISVCRGSGDPAKVTVVMPTDASAC